MSREIYITLSGACGAWAELERIGNDIANAQTAGYKSERLTYKSVGPTKGHEVYSTLTGVAIDKTDGARIADGVDTHMALQGPGYFSVDDGKGGVLLTRDGRFQRDSAGRLTDLHGKAVLGVNGPIVLPPGPITVGRDGTISGVDGTVAKLRLLDGPTRGVGGSHWVATGAMTPSTATVEGGVIEASTVDAASSMVELIQAGRAFEAFQKAMQTSDEMDERLIRAGGPQ